MIQIQSSEGSEFIIHFPNEMLFYFFLLHLLDGRSFDAQSRDSSLVIGIKRNEIKFTSVLDLKEETDFEYLFTLFFFRNDSSFKYAILEHFFKTSFAKETMVAQVATAQPNTWKT